MVGTDGVKGVEMNTFKYGDLELGPEHIWAEPNTHLNARLEGVVTVYYNLGTNRESVDFPLDVGMKFIEWYNKNFQIKPSVIPPGKTYKPFHRGEDGKLYCITDPGVGPREFVCYPDDGSWFSRENNEQIYCIIIGDIKSKIEFMKENMGDENKNQEIWEVEMGDDLTTERQSSHPKITIVEPVRRLTSKIRLVKKVYP